MKLSTCFKFKSMCTKGICNQQRWSVYRVLLNRKYNINTSVTDVQSKTLSTTPINPIDELQPYVTVPIIPENEFLFRPSENEVREGVKLFVPVKHKHDIRFIASAIHMDKLPEYNIPEVAFIGRSNVGKSSLIQAMFSEALDASNKVKVSKKPGFTRALRFFQVGRAFTLVDMPGYGFNMPSHFVSSVEEYLKTRRNLKMTYLLIDGEIGMTQKDVVMYHKLQDFDVQFSIVLTKIDKVRQHVLLKNLMSVIEYRDKHTHCCFAQPFLVSAHKGVGVPLLQTYIGYVAGKVQIQGL